MPKSQKDKSNAASFAPAQFREKGKNFALDYEEVLEQKKKRKEILKEETNSALPSSFAFPEISLKEEKKNGFEEQEEEQPKENEKKIKYGHFKTMGLLPDLVKALLKLNYKVPTPIQRKCFPFSLQSQDIVGMARTGSGKTAAFLIPLLQKLKSHSLKMGARGLILSPTRELALQTFKFCTKMTKFMNLRTCLLVGGDSMQEQFAQLAKNPDIIIATPGRLMHQLLEVEYSLNSIEYVVFDEADRLFEMGFADQLKEILSHLPPLRQTSLFSATLPNALVEFARAGLNDPKVIRLDTEIKLSEMLQNHFLFCREEEKMGMLIFLLKSIIKADQQSIIFVSTRYHVDFLNELLIRCGFLCSFVYGSMDQTARKINVAKFSVKKTNLLIVTDVAARGIDIPLLDNVINYDFPSKPKLFVHRVGRVARNGRTGCAFSFLSTDETGYLLDLQKFLQKPLSMEPPENGIFDTNKIYYGKFPQEIIDRENEFALSLWVGSDLEGLKKTTANAYKLHVSTRPKPSHDSIRATKNFLENLKVHPLLFSNLSGQDLSHFNFVQNLKSFRPNQTIFEIKDRPGLKDLKKISEAVMQKKRSEHQTFVGQSKKKQKKIKFEKEEEGNENNNHRDDDINNLILTKDLRPKSRDPEWYIDTIPENFDQDQEFYSITDIQDNFGFDFEGEDEESIRAKKLVSKWDKKKKKFVKVRQGEDPNSKEFKRKNEAGVKIGKESLKKRGETYSEWKLKSRISIPKHGQFENTESVERFESHQKFIKDFEQREGKLDHGKKSELKTPEQIKKDKKEHEKKKILSMPKSKERAAKLEEWTKKYKGNKKGNPQQKASRNKSLALANRKKTNPPVHDFKKKNNNTSFKSKSSSSKSNDQAGRKWPYVQNKKVKNQTKFKAKR